MEFKYKFSIDIENESIDAEAFTLSDYLDIIATKESEHYVETVIKVIDKCLDVDILEYPKRVAEYILLQLWATSVGKMNYDAEYICCASVFNVPLNMSRAQIDKKINVKKVFPGFTIQFKEPKLFDDSDYVETFMNCIDYIIIENNQFTLDELSDEDYDMFINTITASDLDNIAEELLSSTIRMGVPVKCPICGSFHVEELIGLHDLLGVIK